MDKGGPWIGRRMNRTISVALAAVVLAAPAVAQNAPTRSELAVYAGLHEAAAKGDVAEIESLIKDGEKPNIQDSKSRTPLHVAAYLKQHAAARALLKSGANPNALEIDRYDVVTIAAVANDLEMLKIALEGGASAKNITSRYDGTALIAAAHLGHVDAVKMLIAARAPLNHVNNLGWTALMEAIEPRRDRARAGRGRRRRQRRRPPGPDAAATRAPARLYRDGANFGECRCAMMD